MATLYDHLDRRVADIADDDVFTLSAIRTWVFAARIGRCPQAMLRNGFSARDVADALPAFMCAMAPLDRHGHGTIRFAEVLHPSISDDEARVLTLFAAARAGDPRLTRMAANLVSEEMTIRLAGAAGEVGAAMMPTRWP